MQMSMVSNPSFPALPDYVPPTAAASHSENNIIEGPSRISLNCPISFERIKTPVKGYLCKHLQCFDFDNYVGINSRRPSWPCPHCSQSVCFTDIRIDQTMVKGQSQPFAANSLQLPIHAIGSVNTRSNDTIVAPVTDNFVNANSQRQSQTGASATFVAHEINIMRDPAARDKVDVNHGNGKAFKTFLL